MMIGVVVRLRVDCCLPLAETLERIVGVVADIEPFLNISREEKRSNDAKREGEKANQIS